MVRNGLINQYISRVSYNLSMLKVLKKQNKLSYKTSSIIYNDVKNVIDSIIDYGDYFAINESGVNLRSCKTYEEYEYSSSEMYIDCVKTKRKLGVAIIQIVEFLWLLLCQSLPNRQVCIFISVDEGKSPNINVRFHIYRSNDFYISDDLDSFDQPMLRFLLNTCSAEPTIH